MIGFVKYVLCVVFLIEKQFCSRKNLNKWYAKKTKTSFDYDFYSTQAPIKNPFVKYLIASRQKRYRTRFGIPSIIMQFDYGSFIMYHLKSHSHSSVSSLEFFLISQGAILSWWSLKIWPKIILPSMLMVALWWARSGVKFYKKLMQRKSIG